MELSIDEKMRLIREMREKIAREEERNGSGGFLRVYDGSRNDPEEERVLHGTLGLRMFFALCLFGGFLFLRQNNLTVADKDAQDIVSLISEDSLDSLPFQSKTPPQAAGHQN